MIKFRDCTLAKFTAFCDQRGISGVERDIWVSLFKRCVNAPSKRSVTTRQKRIVEAFINEGRTLHQPAAPIALPIPKINPAQKSNRKSKPKRKK